jgi:hypothetical protein
MKPRPVNEIERRVIIDADKNQNRRHCASWLLGVFGSQARRKDWSQLPDQEGN